MLTGFISENFKIEKMNKLFRGIRDQDSFNLTEKDKTYGTLIKLDEIDEVIMLLEKIKGLHQKTN